MSVTGTRQAVHVCRTNANLASRSDRFSESGLQMYLRPKTFDVCARLAQLVRSLTANPGGLGFNPWAGRGLNFTGSSHRPWTRTC